MLFIRNWACQQINYENNKTWPIWGRVVFIIAGLLAIWEAIHNP